MGASFCSELDVKNMKVAYFSQSPCIIIVTFNILFAFLDVFL